MIKWKKATEVSFDSIVELLKESFFEDELIYKHLNKKRNIAKKYELSDTDIKALQMCYFSGLSTVYFDDQDNLIAASLSMFFSDYLSLPLPENVNREMRLIMSFLDQFNAYMPKNPEKCAFGLAICVKRNYQGKKITYLMNDITIKLEKEKGCEEAMTDSTSEIAINMAVAFGYTPKVTFKYKDFEFEGEKPFDDIEPQNAEAKRMVKYYNKPKF